MVHPETRENSRGIRGVLRVDRRRLSKDNVLACYGRKRKSKRSGDTHRSLQSLPGNRWKDHRLEPNQGSFCSGSQSIATLQLLTEETEKRLQEVPSDTNFLLEKKARPRVRTQKTLWTSWANTCVGVCRDNFSKQSCFSFRLERTANQPQPWKPLSGAIFSKERSKPFAAFKSS